MTVGIDTDFLNPASEQTSKVCVQVGISFILQTHGVTWPVVKAVIYF